MVLLMTMTPLHVREAGHGIGEVGLVISAHTLGMFALSPLSGRLVKQFGPPRVILAGFGVLFAAALVAATAPPQGVPQLAAGLFLLGYGWNLSFVASSTLLSTGADAPERTRLQGMTDALAWIGAGASSIAAGPLLDGIGYRALSLVGAALLVLPAVAILARRVSSTPTEAPTAS
jgi:MFS family permease